mmetsp:Transcript_10843/g.17370  ORF Transcript_10843/g.17370 Transcript_10843/m.17370 type:complete len:101 (-) Transcript_10843:25-327(-)
MESKMLWFLWIWDVSWLLRPTKARMDIVLRSWKFKVLIIMTSSINPNGKYDLPSWKQCLEVTKSSDDTSRNLGSCFDLLMIHKFISRRDRARRSQSNKPE